MQGNEEYKDDARHESPRNVESEEDKRFKLKSAKNQVSKLVSADWLFDDFPSGGETYDAWLIFAVDKHYGDVIRELDGEFGPLGLDVDDICQVHNLAKDNFIARNPRPKKKQVKKQVPPKKPKHIW